MLQITIPAIEKFNSKTNEFITLSKPIKLYLEHSLISISKWEQKFHIPFMSTNLNDEQFIFYVKCMTIGNMYDDEIYNFLTEKNKRDIINYMEDEATATKVYDSRRNTLKKKQDTITNEIIYYWMISLQIPKEMEQWHINRLLKLIDICNIKNSGGDKMTQKDKFAQQRAINKANRAKYHSKG